MHELLLHTHTHTHKDAWTVIPQTHAHTHTHAQTAITHTHTQRCMNCYSTDTHTHKDTWIVVPQTHTHTHTHKDAWIVIHIHTHPSTLLLPLSIHQARPGWSTSYALATFLWRCKRWRQYQPFRAAAENHEPRLLIILLETPAVSPLTTGCI